MTDQMQRFLLNDTDIRGELVCLEQSYQQTLANHQYPPVVATLLGEFLAAAAMLSATLKFEGTLTLQARADGPIPLLMAEASSDRDVRGIAKHEQDKALDSAASLSELFPNGQLCITIDPAKGKRYQGIVALDGESLSHCLESYFQQSEQLSTRIWLCADGQRAAGMLLQELPESRLRNADTREQQWQHATILADTLTAEELLQLPATQLLSRLYPEDPVRVFPDQALAFKCSCSRERTLRAIGTLPATDLEELIAEQQPIDVECEFCLQNYRFQVVELEQLLHPTLH